MFCKENLNCQSFTLWTGLGPDFGISGNSKVSFFPQASSLCDSHKSPEEFADAKLHPPRQRRVRAHGAGRQGGLQEPGERLRICLAAGRTQQPFPQIENMLLG